MSQKKLREIHGNLKEVIENDVNLNNEIQFIENIIKNNQMKLDNSSITTYKNYVEDLKKLSSQLVIDYDTYINNLFNIAKNKTFDEKDEYMQKLTNIRKRITMYFEMLPIIYWRKEDRLSKIKMNYSVI